MCFIKESSILHVGEGIKLHSVCVLRVYGVCICSYVCMHVCMRICAYVCGFMCMCVCMHVCARMCVYVSVRLTSTSERQAQVIPPPCLSKVTAGFSASLASLIPLAKVMLHQAGAPGSECY